MAQTTYALGEEQPFLAVVFVGFVLLGFVIIMNMLIGVLVEVVSVVASVEKETRQVRSVKAGLVRILEDMGVDALALVDAADYIFREQDTLSFEELLDLLLRLRGNNPVRVKDLVDMRAS